MARKCAAPDGKVRALAGPIAGARAGNASAAWPEAIPAPCWKTRSIPWRCITAWRRKRGRPWKRRWRSRTCRVRGGESRPAAWQGGDRGQALGIDKGVGVRALMRAEAVPRPRALFGGDDTTDMDVFHILPGTGRARLFGGPRASRAWIITSRRRARSGNGWRIWPMGGSRHDASQPLDLAVIGNGRTAALVDRKARMVWWCFPRFDSDPVVLPPDRGRRGKGFLRRGAGRVFPQPVAL